jgi:hypothetical protein
MDAWTDRRNAAARERRDDERFKNSISLTNDVAPLVKLHGANNLPQ